MVLHLWSYIPQDIWQLELIKNIWKSALLKLYILNVISTFPKVAFRLNQNHCFGFCAYLCVLSFWSYGCLCSVRRTRFLQIGSGCFLIFLLKSFFFFFFLIEALAIWHVLLLFLTRTTRKKENSQVAYGISRTNTVLINVIYWKIECDSLVCWKYLRILHIAIYKLKNKLY